MRLAISPGADLRRDSRPDANLREVRRRSASGVLESIAPATYFRDDLGSRRPATNNLGVFLVILQVED
jgi:hypothetical protein